MLQWVEVGPRVKEYIFKQSMVLSQHFHPLHRSCTLELLFPWPCQHQQGTRGHKLLCSLADRATEGLWPAHSRCDKVTITTFSALKIPSFLVA